MELTRRKVKNAVKNIEVAIARLEQLYSTEYDMIERLKDIRIQLGGTIQEMDIVTMIKNKST